MRRGGETLIDYALQTKQDLKPNLKIHYKNNPMEKDELKKKGLIEKDELYYYNERLFIPDIKNWRLLLLQQAHDIPTAGHQGHTRTLNKLLPNFYWESLREDCARFVNSCDGCQRNKYSNKQPEGYLIPLEIPNERFETIGIDFTPLPKSSDGKDNLMIIYCKLTKICALIPTTININTKEAARLFFTNWYCRGYGLPKIIICDRDKLFISKMWQDLMNLLEIKLAMSTARHQQTNGGTEHLVKMAKLCLKINCGRDSANWPNSIAATEFALNSSISSATGYSPLALAFGLAPLEISKNTKEIQIHEQIKKAKINIAKAQDKMEKNANRLKSFPEDIKEGDLVLLDRKGLNWATEKNEDLKLKSKRLGPFKVLEIDKKFLNFKLDLPKQLPVYPWFFRSLIKKYLKPSETFPERKNVPEFEKNYPDLDYEIEKILDDRIYRKKLQYKIRWKNWTPEHDSWEPAENINAKELIEDYQQSRGGVASGPSPNPMSDKTFVRPMDVSRTRAAHQATAG